MAALGGGWAAAHSGGDCAIAGRHGEPEHGLGLHQVAGRSQERRVHRRTEHDQADLEGAGHRTGAPATAEYSWATFIKAHLSALAAADFFTVEVLSLAGLVRYHVLFVMDLTSRKVEIAGISRCPDGLWMEQVSRNLLDVADGFLMGKRYLILDRYPLYTRGFRGAMKQGGVEVIRLPPSSPNLNAFAERFVLSIRSECLDRIVPLSESHLRRSVSEYVRHYRLERNHQGLGNDLIEGAPSAANTNGRVQRRERLRGLLNFYHRLLAQDARTRLRTRRRQVTGHFTYHGTTWLFRSALRGGRVHAWMEFLRRTALEALSLRSRSGRMRWVASTGRERERSNRRAHPPATAVWAASRR
jgi:hypothetical protein